MSIVSKRAAQSLKKIGFELPTSNYYCGDETKISYGGYPFFWNANDSQRHFAAPDHLQVGDWFFQNHALEFIFQIYRTKIFSHKTAEHLFVASDTLEESHRDLAIIEACKLIK